MEGPLRQPADPDFRLIETFRWEPGTGVVRRARHVARLRRSADRLGIVPRGVQHALDGLQGDAPLRVRLTVDVAGTVKTASAPFAPLPEGVAWRVAIARARLASNDVWLRVKTTERQFYNAARANLPDGLDELLFLNEAGDLCEGTITNLFVETKEGLVTPPLRCGLLPGVLREDLLATGRAREAVLTPDDLTGAQAIYVGNSLRGLIRVRLVKAADQGGFGPG